MSLRNRNPSEPRRSDQPIKRITSQFNGMLSGEPQTKIPANYCKKNVNVIDRGGYCDIRGGSNKYSTKNLLYGFETGAAYYYRFWKFSSDVNWNIGDAIYFVGSDLPGYKINGVAVGRFKEGVPYYLSYENVGYIGVGEERYFLLYPTYLEACHTTTGATAMNAAMAPDTSIPGSNSTICFVHNYMYDHVKANKIIFVEGSTVYVVDKPLTVFTKVLKLGAGYRLNSSNPVELLSEVSSII
jgi:hypothetical protein